MKKSKGHIYKFYYAVCDECGHYCDWGSPEHLTKKAAQDALDRHDCLKTIKRKMNYERPNIFKNFDIIITRKKT